ncbi:MAG: PAS domain S-box protein [Gammaproteobacteria bacterium]|nr:PAS domain S-box protein [Gammaproteobacteria bacterium]MBT7308615.1 PAS domain S-box protein [Gammaproteobacteria bacterium]
MSFRYKTILGVALIEITLLLFLVWSSMEQMRRSSELQLVEQAQTTASLFSSMVKDSVLSFDLATLESFVSELMKNPGLVYVRVYDREQLLAVGGESREVEGTFHSDTGLDSVTDNIFDIRAPIEESGIPYGRVELGVTTRPVTERLSRATWNASLLALAEILISALFSFILGSWLVRQLEVLRNASSEISSGKLGIQIPAKGSDEIAETIHFFNRMSTELELSTRQLNQLNLSLEGKVEERTMNLARSNQKLSSIMENMGDALFVLDSGQRVAIHNPAAEQLFSQKEADYLSGCPFLELFPQELEQKVTMMVESEEQCRESLFFSSDGKRLLLEFTLTPLPMESAESLKLVLIRDISEQYKLKEKEAMVAFQSGISEMSASIMHNIGNIITGLQGHVLRMEMGESWLGKTSQAVNVALEKQHSEEWPKEKFQQTLQATLGIIKNSNKKYFSVAIKGLKGGLDDIENVIRLQNSQEKPSFTCTQFHSGFFFEDLLLRFESETDQAGITVEVEIEPGLEDLFLPRNQLFQVLLRLIKNSIWAIEQRERGDGRIIITLVSQLRTNQSGLRLTIEDNGIGIEKERIKTLFNFAHTKGEKKGSLGLHESANFIRAIGGSIEMESDGVGRGATLEIWLPTTEELS